MLVVAKLVAEHRQKIVLAWLAFSAASLAASISRARICSVISRWLLKSPQLPLGVMHRGDEYIRVEGGVVFSNAEALIASVSLFHRFGEQSAGFPRLRSSGV